MKSFIAGYKAELSKLTAKKKYIVFLIIAVLICIFNIFAQSLVAFISHDEISLKINNFPILMLPFFAEVLIPLIIFMAVSDSFGTELADSTIKAMLFRPITRLKLMTAKMLACLSVAAGLFLAVLIASTALDVIINGGGGLRKFFIYNLGSYITDLIPMILLIFMAALINLLSRGTTLAMFLCVLIYALLKFFGYFIGMTDGILFTSYLQWHKLLIGNTIPFHALISKIALLCGYGAVMFPACYFFFDKRDF
ncbi:MAG: ABC transporter permease [Oscillospiraceae bacterium]|nr:ABC transporter permease [Oscillospiraceae bacterium]